MMRILAVTAVPPERDAVTAGLADRLPGAEVVAAGVGPAAAAARTATALALAQCRDDGARRPYDLVISAGIGGGFAPLAPLGATVVASAIVAADLGAQIPAEQPGPAANADSAATAGSPSNASSPLNATSAGSTAPTQSTDSSESTDTSESTDSSASAGSDGFASVAELGFGVDRHEPPAALARAVADALGAVHAPVLTVSTATGTAKRAAALRARHPGAAAEAMEGFGVAEAAAVHGIPVLEIRTISNPVGPRDRAAWRIPAALAALTSAFARLAPVLDQWQADLRYGHGEEKGNRTHA